MSLFSGLILKFYHIADGQTHRAYFRGPYIFSWGIPRVVRCFAVMMCVVAFSGDISCSPRFEPHVTHLCTAFVY